MLQYQPPGPPRECDYGSLIEALPSLQRQPANASGSGSFHTRGLLHSLTLMVETHHTTEIPRNPQLGVKLVHKFYPKFSSPTSAKCQKKN